MDLKLASCEGLKEKGVRLGMLTVRTKVNVNRAGLCVCLRRHVSLPLG